MPDCNGLNRTIVTIVALLLLIPSAIFGNDGTGASIVVAVDTLYFLSIPFHTEEYKPWNDRCSRYLVLFLFLTSMVLAIVAFEFDDLSVELTAGGSGFGILACIINLAVPQKESSTVRSGKSSGYLIQNEE
tara:strand:- start:1219 stop:1611 length:393 start_codon:yes stop_codon:yes gene_type:complete